MIMTAAPNLNMRDRWHLTAVEAAGFEATIKVVEAFLGSLPNQARFGRAVRHPAFEVLDADYQVAIRDHHDEDRLRWFARKLLSMLSVSRGLGMIDSKAGLAIWRARISELRNFDRPQAQQASCRNNSARRSRQLARSTAGPKKGRNPQPPKFGGAKK